MEKMRSTLQKQVDEERKLVPGIDPEILDDKVVKVVKERPIDIAVKYAGKALRFLLTLGAFFLACVGLIAIVHPTVRQPLLDVIGAAIQQIINYFQ